MYYIKLDNDYFGGFGEYLRADHEIFDPVLETAVNEVGHFSFTVYPNHTLYNEVTTPKKILYLYRKGDDEPLFVGRLVSYETGFYNEKKLVFESELAFLLDTVWTDFSHSGIIESGNLLGYILGYHSRYGIYPDNLNRKFEKGRVSEELAHHGISVPPGEFKGTFSILEIITRALIEPYGGVLRIRHETDENSTHNYIDWLSENDLSVMSKDPQKIELSSNLINIEKTVQRDELYTVIRPIGEPYSANGGTKDLDISEYDASSRITNSDIAQVIDTRYTTAQKYTDCLYSRSLIQRYGWIEREVKFDGINANNAQDVNAVKAILVTKGCEALRSLDEMSGLTVTAVDLSKADNKIENFKAGDIVNVDSDIHGLHERMLIKAVTLDLDDPSNSTIEFGDLTYPMSSQVSRGATGIAYSGGVSGSSSGRYDPVGSADAAYERAKSYTDSRFENIVIPRITNVQIDALFAEG